MRICANCESKNSKIDAFTHQLRLQAELDEPQYARLFEIANRCPVYCTLEGEIKGHTQLSKKNLSRIPPGRIASIRLAKPVLGSNRTAFLCGFNCCMLPVNWLRRRTEISPDSTGPGGHNHG